jgi:hypothetical protein
MAKDTIEIDVNVGEGVKSMKTLKKEFAEMQTELDGLIPGTQKYIETLQKLGSVKDEIGDLKAEIQAFAGTDAKVAAFGNVIGGVASGFQAAQGAAALLGAESEEVQKALLKVQAASALADGIKGITAMGDSLKVASNVAKQLITQILGVETVTKIAAVAQRVWNAVMAANPIMLVVVAIAALVGGVALLVSAFENSKDATELYIEANNRAIEQSKETVKSIDNEILALSGLAANEKEIIDLKRKRIAETLKQAELDALSAQAQGIKDKELDWSQKILATYLELNGAKYATQVLESDNAKASNKLLKEKVDLVKKSAAELQAFDNEQAQKKIDKDAKAKEDADAKAKKAKEDADAKAKAAAEKKKQTDLANAEHYRKEQAAFIAYEIDALQGKIDEQEQIIAEQQISTKIALGIAAPEEIDAYNKLLRERKEKEKAQDDKDWADARELANKLSADDDQKAADDQKKSDDARAVDKAKAIEAALKTVGALQDVSEAFFAHKLKAAKGNEAETLKIQKKAFEVNKAFSVARAIQDGILSVSGALANTGTLGPGAIALAAVNGVIAAANVAKILASTFEGGSPSNSSSVNVSAPGTFTQAPNVGSGGGNNQTQLNADGSVNKQGQPSVIKAYVVESESAEVSKRVNKLSEQSKI